MKFISYCKRYLGTGNISNYERNINVGDKATMEKIITERDLQLFKEITQDWNPVHFQKEKRSIVHGALLNGLVSAVFGTKLPGPGTILAEQVLKFPNSCYTGDKVTVVVEVVSVRKIVECKFNCTVCDTVVLSGTAKLIVNNKKK